jgi:hypothetical protein
MDKANVKGLWFCTGGGAHFPPLRNMLGNVIVGPNFVVLRSGSLGR